MKYTQKKALRWMVAMGLTMTAFSWGNVEAMPTGGEVRSGDAAHNVDVVSQALYTAFHDMGLTLDDLDAVYVCFA